MIKKILDDHLVDMVVAVIIAAVESGAGRWGYSKAQVSSANLRPPQLPSSNLFATPSTAPVVPMNHSKLSWPKDQTVDVFTWWSRRHALAGTRLCML